MLNKTLTKILLQIRSKETGRQFLMHCLSFFFVDRMEIRFFPFHGKFHLTKAWFKKIEWDLHKEGPHTFDIRILIILWPWDLSESRLFIIFVMLSFNICTLHYKCFSVRNIKFYSSSLLCFGSEHCCSKKVLKGSAFSPKPIRNLLSWITGGMPGNLFII